MKDSKDFIKILYVLCLCALLESCTLPECVHIFNNSANAIDITFVIGDKEQVLLIPPNETLKFEIGALLDDLVKVRTNQKEICYQLLKPNKEFWSFKGFGPFSKIVFKFQFEADNKIYVLPRDGGYPLDNLSVQPYGYPLNPGCK